MTLYYGSECERAANDVRYFAQDKCTDLRSLPPPVVFGLLVLEVTTFLVLIVPLPFTWRRKMFKFLATNPRKSRRCTRGELGRQG